MNINAGLYNEEFMTWECESIFTCIILMRLKPYTLQVVMDPVL